jgi:hypothetical protein
VCANYFTEGRNLIMRYVLLLFLSGCTATDFLPSLQYCDRVLYQRELKEVAIAAQCQVP